MNDAIQVNKLLKKLNISDLDDGRKVFEYLINLLIYLPVGNSIVTDKVDLVKVDSEFIQLNVKIDKLEVVDFLEKFKIIKIV
jgi:hypothetical protein